MQIMPSRRDFLAGLSAAAGGLLGTTRALAAEGPPETTTIRLLGDASICQAPGFIADDLLRAEGFTDIRYMFPSESVWVKKGQGRPRYLLSASITDGVASGEVDFDTYPPGSIIYQLDAGALMTAVAGVHSGCYELFAHEPIRTIRDLKGHSVSVVRLHSASYLQLAAVRDTPGKGTTMRARAVALAVALVLAPLGAKAADLMVWWGEGLLSPGGRSGRRNHCRL